MAAGKEEDRGSLGIHQRERPVLHLGRGVALGVDVADFLHLQRPFQSQRIEELPAQVEEVIDREVPASDAANLIMATKRPPDSVGQGVEFGRDALRIAGSDGDAIDRGARPGT